MTSPGNKPDPSDGDLQFTWNLKGKINITITTFGDVLGSFIRRGVEVKGEQMS